MLSLVRKGEVSDWRDEDGWGAFRSVHLMMLSALNIKKTQKIVESEGKM